MIDFQRILVATDFSAHSRQALTYGSALAQSFGCELLLLHVGESPDFLSQLPPAGEGYFPPNYLEQQRRQAQELGERWLAEANVARSRFLIADGHPSAAIVQTAREQHADMIVVGTHGRGPVAHVLLGSVAEHVVRTAPCPVLTVRAGEHEFVMP